MDEDVLFVAAFLHDIGAIEPFRVKGIEHATRSVQVVEPLVKSYGLTEAKITKIRETILAHMYDAELKPQSAEAIVFHDADTLDFLGDIQIIRIIGLTDRLRGLTPLKSCIFDPNRAVQGGPVNIGRFC